jgi:plasmid stabilization system protein ParE
VVNKKLPVRWDEEAAMNLKTIYKYIKKESPKEAEKVKNELIMLAGSLTNNPEKHPKEPILENQENFRFISKWSYKIIYEITNHEVIIALIYHTSQYPGKVKIREGSE